MEILRIAKKFSTTAHIVLPINLLGKEVRINGDLKLVKAFGKSAHIVLPRDFIGQEIKLDISEPEVKPNISKKDIFKAKRDISKKPDISRGGSIANTEQDYVRRYRIQVERRNVSMMSALYDLVEYKFGLDRAIELLGPRPESVVITKN